MKVTIKQKFADKYTGHIYKVGDAVELTEERIKEIQSVLPKALDVPKKAPAKKAKKAE